MNSQISGKRTKALRKIVQVIAMWKMIASSLKILNKEILEDIFIILLKNSTRIMKVQKLKISQHKLRNLIKKILSRLASIKWIKGVVLVFQVKEEVVEEVLLQLETLVVAQWELRLTFHKLRLEVGGTLLLNFKRRIYYVQGAVMAKSGSRKMPYLSILRENTNDDCINMLKASFSYSIFYINLNLIKFLSLNFIYFKFKLKLNL